jgi:hypothetical protein
VTEVEAEFPAGSDSRQFAIDFEPALEILPILPVVEVGGRSRSARIVSLERETGSLTVVVEGLAGESACLRLRHPELAGEVKGAVLEGDRILIRFKEGREGEFTQARLIIRTRN